MMPEEGQVLIGPQFSEPVRVETVKADGPGSWVLGVVGTKTERYRRVALTEDDLAQITIQCATLAFDGDPGLLRLGLQAYALGIAFEFDPISACRSAGSIRCLTNWRRSTIICLSSPKSASYSPTMPVPAKRLWPACSSGN
jgi:hypothetical protein